jgi:hypothetical protein
VLSIQIRTIGHFDADPGAEMQKRFMKKKMFLQEVPVDVFSGGLVLWEV